MVKIGDSTYCSVTAKSPQAPGEKVPQTSSKFSAKIPLPHKSNFCIVNSPQSEFLSNKYQTLCGERSSSVLRQKSLYFECHSGLDPESNDFNWIPAQASPRRAFAGTTASELM